MKMTLIAALVLIGLGVVALVYGGFKYTSHDRVVDVGPIHIDADREHSVPIAPIAGAVMIAAGAVVLVVGRRSA